MPPTPPSSLSSDDSEDNQSAEMHAIPSSPASSLSSLSPSNNSPAQNGAMKNIHLVNNGSPNSSRVYNTPSSRQPIHTPLISNQPVQFSFFSCSISVILFIHSFIRIECLFVTDIYKYQLLTTFNKSKKIYI